MHPTLRWLPLHRGDGVLRSGHNIHGDQRGGIHLQAQRAGPFQHRQQHAKLSHRLPDMTLSTTEREESAKNCAPNFFSTLARARVSLPAEGRSFPDFRVLFFSIVPACVVQCRGQCHGAPIVAEMDPGRAGVGVGVGRLLEETQSAHGTVQAVRIQ